MKKILCLFSILLAIQRAVAVPNFDPFANATPPSTHTTYSVGAFLQHQTNSAGNFWVSIGSNAVSTTEPLIVSGNLSYPSLPPSTGNSVGFFTPITSGRSACFNLGTAITSGRCYYSMTIKLTDITGVSSSAANNPITCFRDSAVEQANLLQRGGAKLLTKKLTSSTYVFGLGKSSTTSDYVYDGTARNVGDVLFVVLAYEKQTGAGGFTNCYLWINPSSGTFGTTTPPAANVTILNSGTANDLNAGGMAALMIQCQDPATPTGVLDDLRISQSWADVTGGDPAILQNPSPLAVAAGSPATFNITARSTNTLTYRWFKDGSPLSDGGNITGATADTLTIITAAAGDSGAYSCNVTNVALNSAKSASAALTVSDPVISGQPQNVNANYGTAANFSVTALGTSPFTYQWSKGGVNLSNGGNISGSQSSILTVSGVAYTDAGSYSVVVTNSLSSTATSSAAVLTVNDPLITSQPASTTAPTGGSANFSVTATGSGTLGYQWKKGAANLTNGGNITGATASVLTIGSLSASDAATYSVVVTGDGGTVSSSQATLSVITSVAITTQPNSRTVTTGSAAVFAVGANGTSPSYQWYLNGGVISGATQFSYSVASAQAGDVGSYAVVVSNSLNTVTSSVVTLTLINSLRLFDTNLVVIRVGNGGETLVSSGNSMFVDQFDTSGNYVSTLNIPDSGPSAMVAVGPTIVSGVTSSGLTRSANGRQLVIAGYNTNLSSGFDLKTTSSAAVPKAVGTLDPLTGYTLVFSNKDTAFNSTYFRTGISDGTNNFWGLGNQPGLYYFGFDAPSALVQSAFGNGNWRNMAVFNGSIYGVSAVSGNNGVIKMTGLPKTASSGTVLFSGTTGSSDLAVSPDGNTIYVADDRATPNGGIQRYHFDGNSWSLLYTLTSNLPGGARYLAVDFSGANPAIYAVTTETFNNTIVAFTDTGSGSTGTILAAAGLNQNFRGIRFGPVIDPPVISSVTATIVNATNAVVSATVTGSPATYQWSTNGVNLVDDGIHIVGATTTSLTVINVSAGDFGSYTITASNATATVTAAAIIDTPSISQQPVATSVACGGDAHFSVAVAGAGPFTYQWYYNVSTPITDATNASLTVSHVALSSAGSYTVIATGFYGSITSAAGALTVTDSTAPVITITGSNPATVECHTGYSDAGASASDVCEGTLSAITSGTVDTNTPAVYTLTYVATDSSGNSATNTRSVVVQDTSAPSVNVLGANPATVQCHSSFTDGGFSAADTCAGDLSSSVVISGTLNTNVLGDYTLTYTVTDPVSLSASATRLVHVVDAVGPVITVTGDNPYRLVLHAAYSDPGATASDACVGSVSVATSGLVHNAVGTDTVTYTSDDGNGNTNTAYRVVNTVDEIPATVDTQPTNQTIECGSDVTLVSAASGSGTLSYQWYLATPTTTNAVTDATNASLTITAFAAGNVGSYTVVVTNAYGSATSDAAVLTIIDTTGPVVTVTGSNPATTECHAIYADAGATASDVCEGDVTGSIVVSGSVSPNTPGLYTLTYTAQDSAPHSGSATRVVQVVDTTVPVVTANLLPTTLVECHTAFNDLGASASDTCDGGGLTVTTSGSVDTNTPATYHLTYSATDAAGNTGSIVRTIVVQDTTGPVITLTGSNPVTVSQGSAYSDLGGTAFDVCANVTETVTTTGTVNTNTVGSYTLTYTANDGPNSTTNYRTVSVVAAAPIISFVTPSQAVNAGTIMVLHVINSGATPLHYFWRRNGTNLVTSGKIIGADTDTLSVTNVLKADAGSYTVVVTNISGSATSTPNTVITVNDPSILTPPVSAVGFTGGTHTFTVVAGGTPPLHYQWYKVVGTNLSKILGQTTSSLLRSNGSTAGTFSYAVGVTNAAGGPVGVISAPVTMLVWQAPVITTQPGSTNTTVGRSTVLKVRASGSPTLTYQWSKNLGLLAESESAIGTTSTNLTLLNLQTGDTGVYQCTVSNDSGATAITRGDRGVVTVTNTPVHLTANPINTNLVQGNNVSFSVHIASTATTPVGYQWKSNGVPLIGETGTLLNVIDAQAPGLTAYSCLITNPAGPVETDTNLHGKLTLIADTHAPAVTNTYPGQNARLTNHLYYTNGVNIAQAPQFTLAGKVTDNGLIDTVVIHRTFPLGGSDIPAVVSRTAPGKLTYANTLTLLDGTNIFTITATDSGTNSKTYTETIFFVNKDYTLHVNTPGSGSGTTIPKGSTNYGSATDGAQLEVGHIYSIQAIPSVTSVFTNWTDGSNNVLSSSTNLTFTMSPNLTLNANFLVNPILAAGLVGSYNGLFYETTGIAVPNVQTKSAGWLKNLVLKTNGTYSVTVLVGGKTYPSDPTFPLTGKFDNQGNSTLVIKRSGGTSNLIARLSLDWVGTSKQITGTVENTNVTAPWMAYLTAGQAITTFATPQKFTAALIPGGDTNDVETADAGYLPMRVVTTSAGSTTIAGTSPDGTTFSQTVPISKDGKVPLYANINAGVEVVAGWLQVNTALSGTVSRVQDPTNSPALDPAGIINANGTVVGSVYDPNALTLLPYTNFDLVIQDGDGAGLALTNHLQLKGTNLIKAPGLNATNRFSGNVLKSDGSIHASFWPTAAPGPKALPGILFPQGDTNNQGYGFWDGRSRCYIIKNSK